MSAEDDFFLMANLRPAETRLPMGVWVSERGHPAGQPPGQARWLKAYRGLKAHRHDLRIKVSQTHGLRSDPTNTATVAVRPTARLIAGRLSPADLQAVARWVQPNRDAILDYGDSTISTAELLQRLQPLAPVPGLDPGITP
ncbi:MAG: hypothetical protein ACREE4_02965 [Stellaceae bacterium]